MGTRIDEKKEEKRNRLLKSAFDLYVSKGMEETSVQEIAAGADVGKGTFYLYFKNKEELLDSLLSQICSQLTTLIFQTIPPASETTYTNRTILFVNAIVDVFEQRPDVLSLFRRNFAGAFVRASEENRMPAEIEQLIHEIALCPRLQGKSVEVVHRQIYLIAEMIAGMCYSAIIEKKPFALDSLKPALEDILRAWLE